MQLPTTIAQVGAPLPLLAPKKIASAPPPARAPIDRAIAVAGLFVFGAAYSLFSAPAGLLEGEDDSLAFLFVHLVAVVAGGTLAGFFTSAIRPRDHLWQSIYTGVWIGLVWGSIGSAVVCGLGGLLALSVGTLSLRTVVGIFVGLFLTSAVALLGLTVLGACLERRLAALTRRRAPPSSGCTRRATAGM